LRDATRRSPSCKTGLLIFNPEHLREHGNCVGKRDEPLVDAVRRYLAQHPPRQAGHHLGLRDLADQVLDKDRFLASLQFSGLLVDHRVVDRLALKIEVRRIAEDVVVKAPVLALGALRPKTKPTLLMHTLKKRNRIPNAVAAAEIGEAGPVELNQIAV
jgi:hypothetical protein